MDKRAQSIMEYAVLLSVIVAALLCMQIYIKRGMQGNLRARADDLSGGTFYSPGATLSDAATNYVTKAIIEDSDSRTAGDIIFGFYGNSTTTSTIDRTSHQKEDVLSSNDEPWR